MATAADADCFLAAPAAAARSLDSNSLAGFEIDIGLARQFPRFSARSIIPAGRTRAAARESVRRQRASFGKQAHVRIDQALEFPNQSVTAAPSAAATRPAPDSILGDLHRIVRLQRLDRRVERVGHVRMNARSAGPSLCSAGAARDRFVVGKVAIAKSIETADG